jgi:hypothetical protein
LKSGLPSRQMHRPNFSNLAFAIVFGVILTSCSTQQSAVLETGTPQPPSASSLPPTTSIAEIKDSAEFIDLFRIETPGSDSQITSPILLKLLLSPSSTEFVRIELISQSGALLARQILSTEAELTNLNVPINFETNRTMVKAYLIASIEDEYGRLKALDSAAITLLNEGETVVVDNGNADQIQINSPQAEASIQGGSLAITGSAATQPGRALNIELITREGRVLAFGETYPTFEGGDELGAFSFSLDYEVEEPTWVLIGVAERLSGFIIHYASVEVLLLR